MAGKIVTKTTYTLTAITGGNAYFDLKYTIVMDVNAKTTAMTMSGDGDGKFVYSIKANYPISMLNNMNMTYTIDMPQANNAKMIGKLKMVMNTQTHLGVLK